MKDYRHLTSEETEILRSNGCWAASWQDVYVVEDFSPAYVVRVNFYGIVYLGSFSGSMPLPGGFSIPCGVYDATLFNVSVGSGSLIANIHGYIANYDIGEHTYIADVGKIYMEGVSCFGNGTGVRVLNEAGGREVCMYDGMSAQVAYMSAMYRHRKGFSERLDEMFMAFAGRNRSDRGTIGNGVRIENVGMIRNVRIGNSAVVQGCLRLFDGTVASTDDSPVLMGSGIVCTDFIVQSGAVVEDGARISRTFVGQGVRIGSGFVCSDCLFFANSHCENGEAVSVLAGPFTVSHHKSTLMIGSLFSFMNAGSATNFSNHMYKSGPVHQGVFARGVKFGSGAYMALPVKVAPFTTVLGHHNSHLDTSRMPFSYIVESEGKSVLIPGAGLKSSGLFRDMGKWPERDRRSVQGRQDKIIYEVFSPYTVSGMLSARAFLLGNVPKGKRSQSVLTYGGCVVPTSSITTGVIMYNTVLQYYIGEKIVDRLIGGRHLVSDESLRIAMKPESAVGAGEWMDVAGLLSPKAEIQKIMDEVESGERVDIQSLERSFLSIVSNYSLYEWKWVYEHIEEVYGVSPAVITRRDLVCIVKRWVEQAEVFLTDMETDARKEYSSAAMIGFGMDWGEEAAAADFGNVRGIPSDDALVLSLRSMRMEVRRRAEDVLSLL